MGRQTVESLVAKVEADPSSAIAALEAFDAAAKAASKDETKNIEVKVDESASNRLQATMASVTKDETKTIHIRTDRNQISAIIDLLTGVNDALSSINNVVLATGTDVASTMSALAGGGKAAVAEIGKVGEAVGADIGKVSEAAVGELSNVKDAVTTLSSEGAGAGGSITTLLSDIGSEAGAAASAVAALGPALLMGGTAFVAYAALTAVTGAVQALGAAVVGLVATLTPLLGLLGAIPVALGVFGGVAATLYSGLGDVIGASSAMGKATGQTSRSTYNAASAARDLTAAHRGLTDAIQGVSRAQEELKRAQENVIAARDEAARSIRNQRRDLQSAIWAEADAVDRVAQAQENLKNKQEAVGKSAYVLSRETDAFTGKVYEVARVSTNAANAAASGSQSQASKQRDLAKAQQGLLQAQERTKQSREDLSTAEKKGVNGSDVVIAALRRVADAHNGVTRAQEGVVAAQERISRVQADNTKRAQGGTAAINNLATAMGKLGPQAQHLARYIGNDLMPAFASIKKITAEALAPGVEKGLRSIMTLLPMVKEQFALWGKGIGDAFAKLGAHLATPTMKKDLKYLSEGFLKLLTGDGKKQRGLLDALIPITDILISITKAALPLMNLLTDKFVKSLEGVSKWMKQPANEKLMEKFFTGGFDQLMKWVGVIKPLVGIFGDLMKAAQPLADWMLKGMAQELEKISKWTNSKEGQKGMMGFFNEMIPAIRETVGVVSDLVAAIFTIPAGGEESAFTTMMKAIRSDMVPALKDLFTVLSSNKESAGLFVVFVSDIIDALTRLVKFMNTLQDNALFAWLFLGPDNPHRNGDAKGSSDVKGKEDLWNGVAKNGKSYAGSYDKATNTFATDNPEEQKFFGALSKTPKVVIPVSLDVTKATADKAKLTKAMKLVVTAVAHEKAAKKALDNTAAKRNAWVVAKAATRKAEADLTALTRKKRAATIDMRLELSPEAYTAFRADITQASTHNLGSKAQRWSGGPVKKGEPYVVGENRRELFVPESDGRILPSVPQSTGGGISEEQLSRILDQVLAKAKPNNTFDQTFMEKQDPKLLSSEIAWSLR